MDITNRTITSITVITRIGLRITYDDNTSEYITTSELTKLINTLISSHKTNKDYVNELHKDINELEINMKELMNNVSRVLGIDISSTSRLRSENSKKM